MASSEIVQAGAARVFAAEHQEPLVTLPLQHPDLVGDLLHRQGDPGQLLVAPAKTAVEAVVGAVVGDIERGEKDQAVAVNRLFDLAGRCRDPPITS